jgi:hypothetical protein
MTSLTPATTPGGVTQQPRGGAALAMPAGTGAAGAANLSMVRMGALLQQAHKAVKIFEEVGEELRHEATATAETADSLTASFGERISLEQLLVIANMLTQIAEGTERLIVNGADAVIGALAANFQVLVAQEQLHATGADGAYVDSQRRAG